MNYTAFFGTLNPPVTELGYKKVNQNNWVLRMPGIMIVSGLVFYVAMPRFDFRIK